MALNRARVSKDIGLTNSGDYLVIVEYFDSAAPTVVLWAETFNISRGTSTTQLQALVVAKGQERRGWLSDLAAAQLAVPSGTVVTVT